MKGDVRGRWEREEKIKGKSGRDGFRNEGEEVREGGGISRGSEARREN